MYLSWIISTCHIIEYRAKFDKTQNSYQSQTSFACHWPATDKVSHGLYFIEWFKTESTQLYMQEDCFYMKKHEIMLSTKNYIMYISYGKCKLVTSFHYVPCEPVRLWFASTTCKHLGKVVTPAQMIRIYKLFWFILITISV